MKKLLLFVVAVQMIATSYANDVQSNLILNVALSDGLTYYCRLVAHTPDSITLMSPMFESKYGNSIHNFGADEIVEITYFEESRDAVYKRKNLFCTDNEWKLWRKTGMPTPKSEPKSKSKTKAKSIKESTNDSMVLETTQVNTDDDVVKPSADSNSFTYELFTQYIERRQNTPLHKLNNIFLSKGYHGQVIVGFSYCQTMGFPISISTIQGWRFNPIVFMGGGLTLNFDLNDTHFFTMPMFADFQISLPCRFETVYFVWDTQLGASPWCIMGENTPKNTNPDATFKEKAKGGVYFSTGLNFMFGVKDGVSIGFKGQFVILQNGYQYDNSYHDISSRPNIAIGGIGSFVIAY